MWMTKIPHIFRYGDSEYKNLVRNWFSALLNLIFSDRTDIASESDESDESEVFPVLSVSGKFETDL